ncbi:hypothetical protein P4O66_019113 [Electrophorus voltai]|uniref:Cyclin-dependent kinase 5 activator n=1 Tax=Electrophorus voltai TaxID=2609070 RepID=A0AAD8YR33_9TELE|nr:hypothetical protein P4O66_019113 [Electrophorus voltai]
MGSALSIPICVKDYGVLDLTASQIEKKKKTRVKKCQFFTLLFRGHSGKALSPKTKRSMKLASGEGMDGVTSATASKPERLGQASTESMPRLLMQSSTSELLTCLGAFLCRGCCLLKDLTADEPVQWLRIVDRYVTLTEWQEQSFLIPGTVVFLFMLCRDIISAEVATKEELQAVLLTCLYVSCSYMCEEISYPAKAFLEEENKGASWARSLDIANRLSGKMLQINNDPQYFWQVFTDLKNMMLH